jgi:hypothetical protein
MKNEKAIRMLRWAGGVLNVVFCVFHIWLGIMISRWPGPKDVRGLMEALNVGGTLFIGFFAYAFLVRGKDLIATGLGRATLVLAILLYWSRAAEEFFLFTFNPAIFVSCIVSGAIPAALLFLTAASPSRGGASGADRTA